LAREKARYWDKVAEEWRVAPPQVLWRRHSDAVNLALLRRWLPADRVQYLLKTDAFDEGIGGGLYPLLAAQAECIIEMDIAVPILCMARKRYPELQVIGADARCLPFAADSLAIIVSLSTLDHYHSQQEIATSLREFHRVLRPTGQLWLTLDNPVNPLVGLRNALPFRWLNRLGIVPYYVGATYGPRGLRRVLQEIGFDVRETGAVMHCPRVVAVAITRLLERYTRQKTQRRFLHFLLAFERLSYWSTRFLTGHFVAVRAVKR